jgi:hypothetical protein
MSPARMPLPAPTLPIPQLSFHFFTALNHTLNTTEELVYCLILSVMGALGCQGLGFAHICLWHPGTTQSPGVTSRNSYRLNQWTAVHTFLFSLLFLRFGLFILVATPTPRMQNSFNFRQNKS